MSKTAIALAIALFVPVVVLGQPTKKHCSRQCRPHLSEPATTSRVHWRARFRQAWQDWKDKKREAFASTLTDDAIEVEADGKGPRDRKATLGDIFWQFIYINPAAHIVIVVWSAQQNPTVSAVIDDWVLFDAVVEALKIGTPLALSRRYAVEELG